MKRKRKYICWMLAVCMLTFVGAFGNINTAQAATFENGYYCETVQGTLKAEYEVDGQCFRITGISGECKYPQKFKQCRV